MVKRGPGKRMTWEAGNHQSHEYVPTGDSECNVKREKHASRNFIKSMMKSNSSRINWQDSSKYRQSRVLFRDVE